MQLRRLRPYLRISLRALLVAVTLASIGLGVLAHRANRQREIVRMIRAQSGLVDYEYHGDNKYGFLADSPRYPPWLVNMLGVDFFYDVVFVRLQSSAASDETLAAVASLPRVKWLYLSETSVSERGLDLLGRMSKLEWLTLNTAGVSNATLTTIAKLPEIRVVKICSALVTDDGLATLDKCRNLTFLYFEDTEVTEEALVRFHERHPNCSAHYSSPGFKTTAWAPKSLAEQNASRGSNVH